MRTNLNVGSQLSIVQNGETKIATIRAVGRVHNGRVMLTLATDPPCYAVASIAEIELIAIQYPQN